MLVATGSFHLKGDFLSNFVLILIILNLSLWVLYYTLKLWNAHFWTTLGCSFTCYQWKFKLLKSSLWICHLKMIKMDRKLDRKFPFTSAATWWFSTLESGEWVLFSRIQYTTHIVHKSHLLMEAVSFNKTTNPSRPLHTHSIRIKWKTQTAYTRRQADTTSNKQPWVIRGDI